MSKVLVVSPHPDDETLGCGGTLLRHLDRGDKINWLIFSAIMEENNYLKEKREKRNNEIIVVAQAYNFESIEQFYYPTTKLDTIPLVDMIEKSAKVLKQIKPEIIYLPFPGDIHSDHRVVFEVMSACTKQFRYPWIKRLLAYETLSETDYSISPLFHHFHPNVFADITNYLERKIEIMKLYSGELNDFPFPRSERAIRAMAEIRGVLANCQACEAFVLLKEID